MIQRGNNRDILFAEEEDYRELFQEKLNDLDINEIRETTNKSWVLGGKNFKKQIEETTSRQASPKPRGGDRRSKAYKGKSLFDINGCLTLLI